MNQVKNYLKKYHDANLWMEGMTLREAKKQVLTVESINATIPTISESALHQAQVVFSHYDVGHNEEETNKIQELYKELGGMFSPPALAI